MNKEQRTLCPIPTAHRRLLEAHRLWHQTAENYNDPEAFRTYLNATIQALRNLTFALQSEKQNIPDFDDWYPIWQERLRNDSVLKWLNDARVMVVHKADLEMHSTAKATVHTNLDLLKKTYMVPPYISSEEIVTHISVQMPHFVREFVLSVERQWIVEDLPGWELLEGLAHAYSVLSLLIGEAHGKSNTSIHRCSVIDSMPCYEEIQNLGRPPVCMTVDKDTRTANLSFPDGNFLEHVSKQITPKPEMINKVIKRYNLDEKRKKALIKVKDIDSFVEELVHTSKDVLAKDKYHNLTVFLRQPDGRYEIRFLFPTTRTEKYVIWRKIADEVKNSGVDAIIIIAEAWFVPAESIQNGTMPENVTNRKEILTVTFATAQGEYKAYSTEFTREHLGKIKFGPTNIDESRPYYLAPIFNVWQTQGAAAGETP